MERDLRVAKKINRAAIVIIIILLILMSVMAVNMQILAEKYGRLEVKYEELYEELYEERDERDKGF